MFRRPRRPPITPLFTEPDDKPAGITGRSFAAKRIAEIDRKLLDPTLTREWQDRLLDERLYYRPAPAAGHVPVIPGRAS